jgi:PAS domain S-box-containing protein
MNPIQTPPQTPDVDESTGHDDPLDALLSQIINGFFVLTDGQGAVSKWSEPAELLFGLHASEVLGKSLFDTLVVKASSDAEAWRKFLESGEPPKMRALQEVTSVHGPEREEFPLEMVFVPVKLDEGFDFSLFLEDLSFELPRNLMLARMRQQHPVVVRALRTALEAEPQPWDGWRTAGTMVAFRPLQPTPWVEEALAAREAARSEQDAEGEERMDPDPGIQGDSIADLDDAAAVVARLLSALERIEDLERTAADLPVALEEARREAQASRERAESTERKVNEAREEMERARDELRPSESGAGSAELLERIDGLEASLKLEVAARAERDQAAVEATSTRDELVARIEEAERRGIEAAEAAEARLEAALATIAETGQAAPDTGELGERFEELERVGAEAVEAARAELRTEIDRLREEREVEAMTAKAQLDEVLEAAEAERQSQAESSHVALAAALERIDQVHRDAERLREQLGEVKVGKAEAEGLAGEDRRRLLDLQRESAEAQARLDALRDLADELRTEAASAREETAQVSAQLAAIAEQDTHARTDVEKLKRDNDELRAYLEEVRGERDETRAAARDALAQVAEIRRGVEEQEAALAEQLADARRAFEESQAALVGRDEVTEVVEARIAELQTRFEEREAALTEQIAETRRALLARDAEGEQVPAEAVLRIESLVEKAHSDVEELRKAGSALRARVEELAGHTQDTAPVEALLDQAQAQIEAAQLADEALRDQVAALAGEAEDSLNRAEQARAEAAAARADADEIRKEAREAQRVAREAGERVAEVDRASANVLNELRGMRERVDATAVAAKAAQDSVAAARTDAEELRAGIARIGGELDVGRADLSQAKEDVLGARQQAVAATEAAAAAREDAARARRDGDEVLEQLEVTRTEFAEARETAVKRLGAVDARTVELRTQLETVGPRLDAVGAEVSRAVEHATTMAAEVGGAVEQQGVLLRGEIDTVRAGTESAVAELAAARAELKALTEQSATILDEVAMARQQSQAAMQRAQEGDSRMEELRSELNFAISTLDELKAGLTSAGQAAIIARREAESAKRTVTAESEKNNERVTEVFREILGLATRGGSQPGVGGVTRRAEIGQLRAKRESSIAELPKREPRHGFDDAPQPMAVLGLDGKFKELNPAFTKLVGYQEHEFVKAVWPSVHDRAVYAQQQEHLTELVAGELDSVAFQSSYMHSQGLMVPVNGEIRVVRDDEDKPVSLLLAAEER